MGKRVDKVDGCKNTANALLFNKGMIFGQFVVLLKFSCSSPGALSVKYRAPFRAIFPHGLKFAYFYPALIRAAFVHPKLNKTMHHAPSNKLVVLRLLFALLLAVASRATAWAQPLISWDRVLGGESYEELNALEVLPDGIIAGGSTKTGMAFGNPADFSWNILVAKLDLSGNVLWQYTYGADQDERLWALIPTRDGGFLAGGYSYSGINGDKTEPSRGDRDVWIIKLDAQGQLQWDKTYGGLYQDELFTLLEMPAGG